MLDMQLKEHTRTEHAALEKKFLLHIRRIRTVQDYISFLAILYGFYSAVERRVSVFLESSESLSFHSRRKASRILDDIAVYDRELEEPELCTGIPAINSFYSALGAAYVLEGSSLGGRIIAQILSSKLGLDSGFSFFLSYGDRVEEMWNSFRLQLQRPFSNAEAQEVLNGASETFNTFNYWLSTHEHDKL